MTMPKSPSPLPLLPPDLNLARASTLESRAYTDPAFLQRERERIFHTTWQLVGRTEQVAQPGDFFTAEVQGEPVVVLRDSDGVLRALSNVCRHRGSTVATGAGRCDVLRCPYHGWTYDRAGRLLGAPEFAGVEDFDRTQVALPALEVDTYGPLIFVRVARPDDGDAPSLRDYLGEVCPEVEAWGGSLDGYTYLTRREYVIACNWKVYIDNYLEGYHIPIAHPSLFAEIDYRRYVVETRRYHSTQRVPLSARAGAAQKGEGDADGRRYSSVRGERGPLYYWVFPNLMLNFYPDNLSTNLVLPLGPEQTWVLFEWFLPPGSSDADRTPARAEEIAAFSHQVQLEDITLCENVQRGLRSRFYDRGRFCVRRENGVHHFQRLVCEFLGG